jgi:hypothetical protein
MSGRWRFILVEEASTLPVRWQPPESERRPVPTSPSSVAALLRAVQTLMRRGTGPQAWVASYEEDPVAFLLDAVDVPVRLWSADGRLVYQNAAAEHSGRSGGAERTPPAETTWVVAGHGAVARRVVRFQHAGERYVLEIVSPGAEK